MKKINSAFLLVLCLSFFFTKAQTNSVQITQGIINHWYEAPESSRGDTVVFKTTQHILGPGEDPAYSWSDFEIKSDNTFTIKYWRWCPTGNYSYGGTWNNLSNGNVLFNFGTNKCKCEMQVLSVNNNSLTAIIKETTN